MVGVGCRGQGQCGRRFSTKNRTSRFLIFWLVIASKFTVLSRAFRLKNSWCSIDFFVGKKVVEMSKKIKIKYQNHERMEILPKKYKKSSLNVRVFWPKIKYFTAALRDYLREKIIKISLTYGGGAFLSNIWGNIPNFP